MAFVLASSSPRRQEIIGNMGIEFTIIKPDIDETQHTDEAPLDYVTRLAYEKAVAVTQMEALQQDAFILAADTVVILSADTIGITGEGEILGKPTDADDARAMLKRLRNRDHQVCTAFCLLEWSHETQTILRNHQQMGKTGVTMRDYSDDEIDAYIATGDPFDKAGSYAIQHEGFHPVAQIDGSYSNVVGLPEDEVRAVLVNWNVIC